MCKRVSVMMTHLKVIGSVLSPSTSEQCIAMVRLHFLRLTRVEVKLGKSVGEGGGLAIFSLLLFPLNLNLNLSLLS